MTPDESALLEEAYRKHADAVFRTCLRFSGGNREWAMDRSHDAFVKLARHLPRLEDPSDVGGWLHRVAVNTCLNSIRKRKNWLGRLTGLWQTRPPPPPSTRSSPDSAVQLEQGAQQLQDSLARLPAKEQAVITLVYIEQMSQDEVARVLGHSKGYVSKLHKKGLAALRQEGWKL